MPIRTMAAAALALTLAACAEPVDDDPLTQPTDTPSEPANVLGPDPEPGPTGRVIAEGEIEQGSLPPAGAGRRYVGRWAARAELCDSGAWEFSRDRLVTAGEVACAFTDVSEVPGGYDIAATCTAPAPQDDSFTLRFAESAQAMMIEGSEILADTGLIYCGPS